MPKLTFDFSEPEPIYDPSAKDLSFHDPHLVSGTCQFAQDHELRLDVFGNTKEAVVQFTEQFYANDDQVTDSLEMTNEVAINRDEPENDAIDEEQLGETNMLINIHFEQKDKALPVIVNLDIDPPITQGTHHVYTFSSAKTADVSLKIKATNGKVEGQLYHGARNIVNNLDPLLPKNKDKEFTADKRRDSIGRLKRFLDPETMASDLNKLTKESDAKTADASSSLVDMSITKATGNGTMHYALVITGEGNGLSKYRLFGRIERGSDE